MTVRLTELWLALVAQADELGSGDLRSMAETVAQQLLHQAHVAPGNDALAAAAHHHLIALSTRTGAPVLTTRWCTVHLRNRLRPAAGPIRYLTVHSGTTAVFVTTGSPGTGTQQTLWEWRIAQATEESYPAPLGRPREIGELDRPVTALAVDVHGQRAVTGDAAGEVISWPLRTGGARRTIGRVPREVSALCLSESGQDLFVADGGGRLFRWDLHQDTEPIDLATDGRLGALATVGGLLVGGNQYGRIQLWRAQESTASVHLGYHPHGESVRALRPAGNTVLSLSAHTLVCSRLDGAESTVLGHHDVPMNSLALVDNGAVVGDSYGRVLMWPLTGGDPVVLGRHDRAVYAAESWPRTGSPGSDSVVTAGKDGLLLRWSAQTDGEQSGTFPRNVWAMSVDTTSQTILIGGYDGLYRWSPAAGGGTLTKLDKVEVFRAAVLPGNGLAVVTYRDGRIRLVDVSGRNRPVEICPREDSFVTGLAIAGPDRFLTVRTGGVVDLWSQASGDSRWQRTQLGRHAYSGQALRIAVCPFGLRAVSAGEDGRLVLWKLTGGSAQEFSRNPHSVKQLAFSRDGKAVFTGDQAGRLVRWSLPDGQRPSAVKEQTLGHHLGGASIQAVLPLAGGRWVVTGGDDGAVCCWEAQARTQASEPSAKLVPASIPLRIVEWEGGLLVADRNGGASLLDLVTPVPVDAAEAESAAVAERTPHLELRAATPRTLPAPESLTGRVVLVDQAWLRGQPRADLGRLLAEIGGSTAVGILCCPDVPGLATFRHALASIGYAILDVPVTAAARRRPVVDFLRRLGPRTSPVLITGDQVLIDDLHEAGLAVEIVDDIGPFAFGDR